MPGCSVGLHPLCLQQGIMTLTTILHVQYMYTEITQRKGASHDSYVTHLALADVNIGFLGPAVTQLLQLLQSFLQTHAHWCNTHCIYLSKQSIDNSQWSQ